MPPKKLVTNKNISNTTYKSRSTHKKGKKKSPSSVSDSNSEEIIEIELPPLSKPNFYPKSQKDEIFDDRWQKYLAIKHIFQARIAIYEKVYFHRWRVASTDRFIARFQQNTQNFTNFSENESYIDRDALSLIRRARSVFNNDSRLVQNNSIAISSLNQPSKENIRRLSLSPVVETQSFRKEHHVPKNNSSEIYFSDSNSDPSDIPPPNLSSQSRSQSSNIRQILRRNQKAAMASYEVIHDGTFSDDELKRNTSKRPFVQNHQNSSSQSTDSDSTSTQSQKSKQSTQLTQSTQSIQSINSTRSTHPKADQSTFSVSNLDLSAAIEMRIQNKMRGKMQQQTDSQLKTSLADSLSIASTRSQIPISYLKITTPEIFDMSQSPETASFSNNSTGFTINSQSHPSLQSKGSSTKGQTSPHGPWKENISFHIDKSSSNNSSHKESEENEEEFPDSGFLFHVTDSDEFS